ncbi:MAG: deoxyguanosinetriphosphate triphosphohydrolase [Oscillospiraceae bacterium]|nr:deoxyguanosinetriphosphate triphosphohydrolase [Oscillospiraceae bacterium]
MNIREKTEWIERCTLSENACLSQNTRGRARVEEKCEMRTDFQRDRDRILHCKAFRRLKQKTQVFLSPEGDHYRTRLTHTLEVSQIARTIARSLRLNEDLTEAIALGHDLGHTPFGHEGERVLNLLSPTGYYHYIQSGRVVEILERDLRGLNLTREVVNGIVTHTKGDWAYTLEGCAVRYADRIAYINHDIEDAITAGVLCQEQLPKSVVDTLGDTKSRRITTLITDLVENSDKELKMSQAVNRQYELLHKFMYDTVYLDSQAKIEEHKVEKLITELYEYFCKNPAKMPLMYQTIAKTDSIPRAVTDYISGMSDDFASRTFEDLFIPKKWQVL